MLYKAIGVGNPFVKILLNRIGQSTDAKHAEILAAYAVFMAKESVEGCGQFTTVATLHSSTIVEGEGGSPARLVPPSRPITYLPYATVYDLENRFRNEWALSERKNIWGLISQAAKDLEDRT